MKKFMAFVLAAVTCATMGVTLAACDGDDSPSSSPSPSSSSSGTEVKTTVTETEWNASFDWGTNWTVSMAQVSPEMGTGSGTYKRDGNKFLIENTYTEGTETKTSASYAEIVGDKVYRYYTVDGIYEKSISESTPEEWIAEAGENIIPTEMRTYADYTYNETTKAYEKASATVFGSTVTDIKAYFADTKISKVEYKIATQSYSSNVTCTFTYGGASVTLPTVEEPEVPEMTAEQWAQIMNITTTNFQITQNIYMTGTNTLIQATVTTKYGDAIKEEVREGNDTSENYFEKDGDNYYSYGLYNGTWVKNSVERDAYDNRANGYNFNLMFGFDDFTYNSQTGTYDCALVANSPSFGANKLRNVSVTISDGGLRKVVWTRDMMGDTVDFEFLISYGIQFELPEVAA